ncbi:MAG: thioredoxin domain-containing protein [Kofleriaceae bacterium]
MASSCEKKPSKTDTGAITALDHSSGSAGVTTSNDKTALAGIDISKLDADKTDTFYKLVNSMKSPCGKSESLRKSFTTDTACKRAPFAVRYLASLLEDEFPEDKIREAYVSHYEAPVTGKKLDTSKAPRIGNNDAAVTVIEFFDYACPHCAEFKPVLEAVSAAHPGQVVEYFMMFPLGQKFWPHSKSGAQAAIAANAQGKFPQMHDMLFAKTLETQQGGAPAHSKSDVLGYAKSIGLDLAKFEADYEAAATQVETDKAQGSSAGVESTPGIFINGRRYEGPIHVTKYVDMWVLEEIAVNR